MIWPFKNEASRKNDEDLTRKKREVEEISKEIRSLSRQIIDAMNCQKMLVIDKKTKQ